MRRQVVRSQAGAGAGEWLFRATERNDFGQQSNGACGLIVFALSSDFTPKVVANTITALADIHTSATSQPSTSSSDPAVFNVTPTILNKLLIALNECSEWGRVAILSALSRYQAQDEKESEHICERVVPQFQHVNGSVVLAAVRVCLPI